MSLKETWEKWKKEEEERKPEIRHRLCVSKNGYIFEEKDEVWHYSIYDFVTTLKRAFKATLLLYLIYFAVCLVFTLMGNKYMHIPVSIGAALTSILRLYVAVAIVYCYKYIISLVCAIFGTVFLAFFVVIACTVLFLIVQAIV